MSDRESNIHPIVRDWRVAKDGEVTKGNVCTARYMRDEGDAGVFRWWMATFAPAPIVIQGMALESVAINRLADQIAADVEELRDLASKLAREGR